MLAFVHAPVDRPIAEVLETSLGSECGKGSLALVGWMPARSCSFLRPAFELLTTSTVFVPLMSRDRAHEREANGLTYSRCPANTDDLAMPLFVITRLSADFTAFFPSRYGVSLDTGRVLFLAGLLYPAQAYRGGAGDTSSVPHEAF